MHLQTRSLRFLEEIRYVAHTVFRNMSNGIQTAAGRTLSPYIPFFTSASDDISKLLANAVIAVDDEDDLFGSPLTSPELTPPPSPSASTISLISSRPHAPAASSSTASTLNESATKHPTKTRRVNKGRDKSKGKLNRKIKRQAAADAFSRAVPTIHHRRTTARLLNKATDALECDVDNPRLTFTPSNHYLGSNTGLPERREYDLAELVDDGVRNFTLMKYEPGYAHSRPQQWIHR